MAPVPATPDWMKWEWCPGRYEKPQAGYYRGDKPRGICISCGADHSLNKNGTVRHHWRKKQPARQPTTPADAGNTGAHGVPPPQPVQSRL